MQNKLNIMDVTVRDGSYAINFKYTAEQVKKIVLQLQSAGVEWAEIGHGLGFGAGKAGFSSTSTDEEQISAVLSAIKDSKKSIKVGVIAGPPILKINELKAVAKDMDFVRLACNVTLPEVLKEFIPACRKMGLKVFVQMMRSSAVPAKKAADSAAKLAKYGAEVIYIVDTAGAFLPGEPAKYVKCVQDSAKTDIGFHAHNNLMLAMANTIEAIHAGASFADASLRGMGRGAGNVPIEMLVPALRGLGLGCKIDEKTLIAAAEGHYLEFMQYLPSPSSYDTYMASRRRDFFPFILLEMVAKEINVSMFKIIDQLADLEGGRELSIDDLVYVIKKLGKDETEVFKKMGIIPSG